VFSPFGGDLSKQNDDVDVVWDDADLKPASELGMAFDEPNRG
jgi:hypothetical protein